MAEVVFETGTLTCSKCGTEQCLEYNDECNAGLKELGYCFMCWFWSEHAKRVHEPESIRIDGHHYRIGPEDAVWPRGFGGRKHRVEFFDGRTVNSSNLWFQGEIPERWRDALPDNARFLQADFVFKIPLEKP